MCWLTHIYIHLVKLVGNSLHFVRNSLCFSKLVGNSLKARFRNRFSIYSMSFDDPIVEIDR